MAQLTYKAPGRSRERLLLFGPEGTGKTSDLLTIARHLPHVTFHWIDNDNSLDRLLETEYTDLGIRWEDGEEVSDQGNIALWSPEDWEEHEEVLGRLFGDRRSGREAQVDRDDWVVVDTASAIWDVVQDWAAYDIYGTSKDELTEKRGDERRGDKKNLLVFEGEMDYGGKINPRYRRFFGQHLMRPPCHLGLIADMAAIDERDKDKQTASLYGRYGVKPRGQKRIGQSVQTVLMKERVRGEVRVTTIKDRGREMLVGEEYGAGEFFEVYVKGVAGWKRGVEK